MLQYRRELRNEIIINKYKMKETVTKLKNDGKVGRMLTLARGETQLRESGGKSQ